MSLPEYILFAFGVLCLITFIILFVYSLIKKKYKCLLTIPLAIIGLACLQAVTSETFELNTKVVSFKSTRSRFSNKSKFEGKNVSKEETTEFILSAQSTKPIEKFEITEGQQYVKLIGDSKDPHKQYFLVTLPPGTDVSGETTSLTSASPVEVTFFPFTDFIKLDIWKDAYKSGVTRFNYDSSQKK